MKVAGSDWIDIRDEHPPVNGRPVLVCLAKEFSGSHQHVARYNITGTGKPMGVIANQFAFDLPPVTHWQELGALPWHQGYPEPKNDEPQSM
jgi:Protein of unknown function (DUF551)